MQKCTHWPPSHPLSDWTIRVTSQHSDPECGACFVVISINSGFPDWRIAAGRCSWVGYQGAVRVCARSTSKRWCSIHLRLYEVYNEATEELRHWWLKYSKQKKNLPNILIWYGHHLKILISTIIWLLALKWFISRCYFLSLSWNY